MDSVWSFSSLRLDNKVAVVAGVGGLGDVTARGMADAGADLVVADLDASAAEVVAKRINETGRQAHATKLDISRPEDSQRLVDYALEKFGRIDVMVNTVGTAVKKPSVELTEAEWDRVLDVNLKGAFFCAVAAARAFIRQGTGGKIITFASHFGLVAMEERIPYSSSKAGIVNMTRGLACEWAPYKVNVNAIAPVFTRTAISEKVLSDPAFYQRVIDRIPMKRLGQPEDIVGAVVYLASGASSFVTGQTLVVDGGWLAW